MAPGSRATTKASTQCETIVARELYRRDQVKIQRDVIHRASRDMRALAQFMRSGNLERHLERPKRVCARKREVLAGELAVAGSLARVGGLEAGFHVHLDRLPKWMLSTLHSP